MCRKLVYLVSCVLVLGAAGSVSAALDPALVGWWTFDEGSGNVAHDFSGNGNDGSFNGDPQWVDGWLGGALEFDGSGDFLNCGNDGSLAFGDAVTMAVWIRVNAVGVDHKIGGNQDDANGGYKMSMYSNNKVEFEIRTAGNSAVLNRDTAGGTEFQVGTWYHVAGVYSLANGYIRTYVNGELDREMATTQVLGVSPGTLYIGCEPYNTGGNNFNGAMDDLQLYNRALSAEEIQAIMEGLSVAPVAVGPRPADKATDVPRRVTLSWLPGEFAAAHDVYLGTVLEDVQNADRSNPLDVLVREAQDANSYDAGVLAYGQTYYWRIDEVNAPPDSTVVPGDIWSFTIEPLYYEITNVTASASIPSFADTQGPDNTVDGSGLGEDGQHSTADADMWQGDATGGGPVWLQYEFDGVYKLEEMKVWNYNSSFEGFLGFGAKNVTIEYSTDGTDWAVLGDYEWTQAPGRATYTSDILVDFGGVPAGYVRININANFNGGAIPRYGMSEVQFFYTPVYARDIEPANRASNVDLDVVLSWRAGREAITHEVYFSEDRQAVESSVALADMLATASYRPAGLEYGKTYYWRVAEVNEAETPPAWASDVMSFRTAEYEALDDFEDYTDDEGNEIFATWIDGYGVGDNGSQVGNDNPPYAEESIVYTGQQSMPLKYDNTGGVVTSVAERTFSPPADWTAGGADTLLVRYRGNPIGFVPVSDSEIIMSGLGNDIWDVADQFRYVYKPLSGNGSIVAKVVSADYTNEWAKIGVMIRETLQDGSAHAFVAVTPSQGVALQYRAVTNNTSTSVQQTDLAAPYWVKLTRSGNQFTAQRSADGVTWVSITDDPAASTVEIPMGTNVYVGLAVCSHNANTAASAHFSNVATTGGAAGQWQSASIGLDQPVGNLPDTLSLTVTDGNGKSKTVANPDPYAVGATSWTLWRVPFSELTSAGVNVANVAKLALTIGNPGQSSSGASGVIYIDDVEVGRPAVHTGPADVTTPGDTVMGVPHDGDWPAGERPLLALDNRTSTKFLHFKGEVQSTGLRVTPVFGPSIVTGLMLTTANDAAGRDPVAFELYGSNDGIDGPYTLIAAGDIVDFAGEAEWPRFTMNETPIEFENATAYTHYQLLFPAVRSPSTANSMQIAEVELIGTLVP